MASSVVEDFDAMSSANTRSMIFEEEHVLAFFQEGGTALIGALIVFLALHLSGWRPLLGAWSPNAVKKVLAMSLSPTPPVTKGAANTEQHAFEVSAMQAFPQFGGPAATRLLKETCMLASQVSAGHARQAPGIINSSLRRLCYHHPELSKNALAEQLVLSAVRACTSKRLFTEALHAYRQWAIYVEDPPCNLWSSLLWASLEAQDLDDAAFFIGKLHAAQKDGRWEFSQLDCWNVAWFCFRQKDMLLFQQALQQWGEAGFQMTPRTRNRILAFITANPNVNGLDFATELIQSISYIPLDTVAYNTLMKGYVAANKRHVCLQLYDQMREDGITPSNITFGLLLDCIKSGNVQSVKKPFEDLRASGILRNTVQYTIFIRNLVAAGDLDHALEILAEMEQTLKCRPDAPLCHTIAKAYADAGRVEEGISFLQRAMHQGLTPDETLFNSILRICCSQKCEASQILSTFNRICALGFVPDSATLSILVNACTTSESVMLALEIVEGAPQRYGCAPEQRIYVQLAQAACSAGLGDVVLRVYALMIQALGMTAAQMDGGTRTRFCRFCEQCRLPAERYAHVRAFGGPAGRLPQLR